jgi:hypothetical protein
MTDPKPTFILGRDIKSRAPLTEEEHRQLWRDIPDEFVPPWDGDRNDQREALAD